MHLRTGLTVGEDAVFRNLLTKVCLKYSNSHFEKGSVFFGVPLCGIWI